jgi:cell division protein FtsB
MLDFECKIKKKKRLYSLPVIVLSCLVFAFLVKANISMYAGYKMSNDRREQIENQFQELSERKGEIETDINHLDSKVGIEEELRSRKNLAKADEKVLILLEEKEKTDTQTDENARQGFWQKIKALFK